MAEMISYEERVCKDQILSFNYVSEFLKKSDKKFNNIQQRVLKIRDNNDKFTNLGYILSDQNQKIIRVTVYDGDEMVEVGGKHEFKGSVLQQYFDIMSFLEHHNRTFFTFYSSQREETWEYPRESIKQVLLNMLIHADYEVKDPNVIKIFSDRMEFSSFGGLMNSIKYDDLFIGMSVPRNKALANFFKNCDLSSNFGLGIGLMRDNYSKSLTYPKVRVNDSIFNVVLPNQRYAFEEKDRDGVHLSLSETNKMLDVLAALKIKEQLSKKEIQELLKVSATRAAIIVEHLVNKEILATTENESGGIAYTRPK